MTPRSGLDASSRDAFELLSYQVDGRDQSIRRSSRRTGQTYTVTLDDVSNEPVRVRYVFRTLTPMHGHRLFVQLPQPARGLVLTVDYTDSTIARMAVTETVATWKPIRVSRLPMGVPGRAISVDVPGWLLPNAGFAFTWTLDSELPRSERSEAA